MDLRDKIISVMNVRMFPRKEKLLSSSKTGKELVFFFSLRIQKRNFEKRGKGNFVLFCFVFVPSFK